MNVRVCVCECECEWIVIAPDHKQGIYIIIIFIYKHNYVHIIFK